MSHLFCTSCNEQCKPGRLRSCSCCGRQLCAGCYNQRNTKCRVCEKEGHGAEAF